MTVWRLVETDYDRLVVPKLTETPPGPPVGWSQGHGGLQSPFEEQFSLEPCMTCTVAVHLLRADTDDVDFRNVVRQALVSDCPSQGCRAQDNPSKGFLAYSFWCQHLRSCRTVGRIKRMVWRVSTQTCLELCCSLDCRAGLTVHHL